MVRPSVSRNYGEMSLFSISEPRGVGRAAQKSQVLLGQRKKIEPQLLQLGYQIIAVNADQPSKMRETIQKHSLNYLLLSDSAMEAAQAFGLAFRVDEKTVERYRQYGIDLEAASGEKHHLLPVPAAFVIGTDGVIKFEYVNPNYQMRIDPDILLAAARAASVGIPKPRN